MIHSTVVIPVKNRLFELSRAVCSIEKMKGADGVEIIIIDDFSDSAIEIMSSMCKLTIIRLPISSGAAVARNKGIELAKGYIIYLLDSDDYFLEHNFYTAFLKILTQGDAIYYSDIKTQGGGVSFPNEIISSNYLDFVLHKYPNLCQTSSLCFPSRLGLRFDESLPRHQDWDFVLTALLNGVVVRKGSGVIFFDRSDKQSISRRFNHHASVPWFCKIKKMKSVYPFINTEQVFYHLFGCYVNSLGWFRYFFLSFKFLLKGQTSFKRVIISFVYRFR